MKMRDQFVSGFNNAPMGFIQRQMTSLATLDALRVADYDSGPNFVTSLSPNLVIATTHSNFIRFLI